MQSLFNPNNKAGLFDGSFSWGKGGAGGQFENSKKSMKIEEIQ